MANSTLKRVQSANLFAIVPMSESQLAARFNLAAVKQGERVLTSS